MKNMFAKNCSWTLFQAIYFKENWNEKYIQISRKLRKSPHPELLNKPPLDSLEVPSPNPLKVSHSPDPIQQNVLEGCFGWWKMQGKSKGAMRTRSLKASKRAPPCLMGLAYYPVYNSSLTSSNSFLRNSWKALTWDQWKAINCYTLFTLE